MNRIKNAGISLVILALSVAWIGIDTSFTQDVLKQYDETVKSNASDQQKGRVSSTGKDVVIGYLESRDKRITILRGPKGTAYTVQTKDGKTLAAKMSEGDLKTKYPAIFNQIKNGLAGNDASIRRFPEHPIKDPAKR